MNRPNQKSYGVWMSVLTVLVVCYSNLFAAPLRIMPLLDSITWTSLPQASYRVEESINLQAWRLLDANFPSAGTVTQYNRAAELITKPKAFYRVSENP